jgi:hypothetical protein
MSGYDPTKRPEALGERAAANMVAQEGATESVRSVVRFLQDVAGIPCYALLPYPVVFVILSRWFYVFPDTPQEHNVRLSRWLWRAVINGTHVRAEVSKFRHQVQLIDDTKDQDAVLLALETEVGEPSRIDWKLERFNSKSAKSRAEILVLLSLSPLDSDRAPIRWRALLTSGERLAREIFASSSWKELPQEIQDLARTAANRALLESTHTGLVSELKGWNSEQHRDALSSHLLDADMLKALKDRDITSFLLKRRARLQMKVNCYLTQKAGIDEPLLRLPESYFVQEDS